MPARVPTPTRRDGDTQKAYAALCDYARMGPGRSIEKLQHGYSETTGSEPPTRSLRWLYEWSRLNDWQARVAEYDAAMQAVADEEAEREMLTGLALPRERVRTLKMLAGHLLSENAEKGEEGGDGIAWLTVTLASPQRLAQLRGLLDDLARETGGRVAKTHNVTEEYSPADFTLDENRRIAAGESPADVRASREAA